MMIQLECSNRFPLFEVCVFFFSLFFPFLSFSLVAKKNLAMRLQLVGETTTTKKTTKKRTTKHIHHQQHNHTRVWRYTCTLVLFVFVAVVPSPSFRLVLCAPSQRPNGRLTVATTDGTHIHSYTHTRTRGSHHHI